MAYLVTADYIQEQMATLGLKSSFSPTAYAMTTLITEASDWAENYCDRIFGSTSAYTEANGLGFNRLVLDYWPVTAIHSVSWADYSGQTGTHAAGDFRVRHGGIIEFKNPLNGPFYTERLYTVNYQTGYATIPSNVQRAVALKVANLVQPQYQGPQDREVFMVTNLEQMIVDLLEPYRRERLG